MQATARVPVRIRDRPRGPDLGPSFYSPDDREGFFETRNGSLEAALSDYAQCNLSRFRPCKVSVPQLGEKYDLRSVIRYMQEGLDGRGVTTEDFCALGDRIVAVRRMVVDKLAFVLHLPVLATAAKPAPGAAAAELVQARERLYDRLARHHAGDARHRPRLDADASRRRRVARHRPDRGAAG